MTRPTKPCHWCGVQTGVRPWEHEARCTVYKRWANGGLVRRSVTGRERVTPEGVANRIGWDF